MIKFKFIFLYILKFISIFIFISCNDTDLSPNTTVIPTPPKSLKTYFGVLDYENDCHISNACTLTVRSNVQNFLPVTFNSDFKKKDFSASNFLQFTILLIETLDLPALLQTSPGVIVETNWFTPNSPLNCMIDTSTEPVETVICQNFAPLADHVKMLGIFDDEIVIFEVVVDARGVTPSPAYTSGEFAPYEICGQYGATSAQSAKHYSTLHRMYDCSKRITSYAGKGNGDSTYIPFVLGTDDPASFWFIVGCPDNSNQPQNHELCSWLSPEIQPDNPIIANTQSGFITNLQCENGTINCDPTSELLRSGTRILWSGLLDNMNTSVSFYQANGSNSAGEANCLNKDGTPNTQCACYTKYDGVCGNVADAHKYLSFRSMSTSLANPSFANFTNFCVQQRSLSTPDPSFSGMVAEDIYHWQIPPNSFIYTLTGGKRFGDSGLCDVGQSWYNLNYIGPCLSTKMYAPEYYGFRAIDPIPAFLSRFWTSSLYLNNYAWYFYGSEFSIIYADQLHKGLAVRCASLSY